MIWYIQKNLLHRENKKDSRVSSGFSSFNLVSVKFLFLPLIYLCQEWFQHCLHFLARLSFNWLGYLLITLALVLQICILQQYPQYNIDTYEKRWTTNFRLAPWTRSLKAQVFFNSLIMTNNHAGKKNLKFESVIKLFDFRYTSRILFSVILLKVKLIYN